MDMISKNNILAQYENGNTFVTILEDGTKIRKYEGKPISYFPESLDVKITNYCDLGCKFCHESSTVEGKHGDLKKLRAILISLPAGVELAIGGGNPLDHPDLIEFLVWCQERGLICNMTVNQLHLKKHFATIETLLEEKLIKGLGISINGSHFDKIKELKKLSNNIVYHVIAGVHDISILETLQEIGNCKVLILGYKIFGRGEKYFSTSVIDNIKIWRKELRKYLGKFLISFDNLALEQLKVKDIIEPIIWNQSYMGDDFTFTMYIDAVKQEYAPTSRSDERTSFNEMSLFEYFINNKK
jgi:MoaA/NifB/PqqE/SkfB family radical SAM enzyme